MNPPLSQSVTPSAYDGVCGWYNYYDDDFAVFVRVVIIMGGAREATDLPHITKISLRKTVSGHCGGTGLLAERRSPKLDLHYEPAQNSFPEADGVAL